MASKPVREKPKHESPPDSVLSSSEDEEQEDHSVEPKESEVQPKSRLYHSSDSSEPASKLYGNPKEQAEHDIQSFSEKFNDRVSSVQPLTPAQQAELSKGNEDRIREIARSRLLPMSKLMEWSKDADLIPRESTMEEFQDFLKVGNAFYKRKNISRLKLKFFFPPPDNF